jgi:polar amino acid transport system substrate-binding protein
MRMRWRLVVVAALVGVLGACGSTPSPSGSSGPQGSSQLDKVQAAGVLRICADPEWVPALYKDESGQITGFLWAIADKMASELKVKLEWVESNWDGVLPGLQSGKCDMLMTSMTAKPARTLAVTFAKPDQIFSLGLLVRANDTRTKIEEFNTPDTTFCVQQNTLEETAVAKWFPKAQVTKLPNTTDCLLAVQANKAHAKPTDNIIGGKYAQDHPEVKMILTGVQGLGYIPSNSAVPKNDWVFKNYIDTFIMTLINEGDYKTLYEQYVGLPFTSADLQELMLQRGNTP